MKFTGLEVRVAIVFSHIKRIFSHLCLITELSIRKKVPAVTEFPSEPQGTAVLWMPASSHSFLADRGRHSAP